MFRSFDAARTAGVAQVIARCSRPHREDRRRLSPVFKMHAGSQRACFAWCSSGPDQFVCDPSADHVQVMEDKPAMQTFRKISEFDVGDVLGVGTVGTIYRATEKATGQQVAIKKLHPGVSQDPLIRARFRREMSILERLSHPHIVSYFGGGEDDGTLFYVMELIDGGTVKSLLQIKGVFDWQIVAELTRQISSALQYAQPWCHPS